MRSTLIFCLFPVSRTLFLFCLFSCYNSRSLVYFFRLILTALSKLEVVKNESRNCRLSESATNRVAPGDFLVGSNCDVNLLKFRAKAEYKDARF